MPRTGRQLNRGPVIRVIGVDREQSPLTGFDDTSPRVASKLIAGTKGRLARSKAIAYRLHTRRTPFLAIIGSDESPGQREGAGARRDILTGRCRHRWNQYRLRGDGIAL